MIPDLKYAISLILMELNWTFVSLYDTTKYVFHVNPLLNMRDGKNLGKTFDFIDATDNGT